jgi:conserved oligomeric Golgi complex subunit 6
MRQAHQASLEDAQASHQEELETQVNVLEKQTSNLKLELKATQDDLAKAKAGLEAALALEGTLKRQIEQKDAEAAAAHVPVDQSEEVTRLTKELANAQDDLLNLTEAFNASKESFQQISNNHQLELEEAAKSRAEEVTKLRESHEGEGGAFRRERDELTSRVSELEVELATLRATAEAQPAAAPLSPRKDTNGAVPGTSAVTKEELQRMHEAHNLKLYELETSHEQSVKGLTEKLEAATQVADDQQALAERLQMELGFSEQATEDHEDELKQYVRIRTLILSACFGIGYLYYLGHSSGPF